MNRFSDRGLCFVFLVSLIIAFVIVHTAYAQTIPEVKKSTGDWILSFDPTYAQTNLGGFKSSLIIEDTSRLSNRSLALGVANPNLTGVGDVLGVSIIKPFKITDDHV